MLGRDVKVAVGAHTFWATRITACLDAGGTLNNAQAMAAPETLCMTKLYHRTGNEIMLVVVERMDI